VFWRGAGVGNFVFETDLQEMSSGTQGGDDDVSQTLQTQSMVNRSIRKPEFWDLYFMDDLGDSPNCILGWVHVTTACREYFRTSNAKFSVDQQSFVVRVDLESMKQLVVPLPAPLNEFITLLFERPIDTTSCCALALHQVMLWIIDLSII
jgi:hypothetical protein